MSGPEARTPAKGEVRRKTDKELTLRPPEDLEEYNKWRKKLPTSDTIAYQSLKAYPVDLWSEFDESFDRGSRESAVLYEYSDSWLAQERFDMLYYSRTLQSFNAESRDTKRFFRDTRAIRATLNSLITAGRLRAATYLLKTIEKFYPKRGISPAEFAEFLPDYPKLPVSYSNMEARFTPEKHDPLPIRDTLDFCIQEALLGDLLHLSHDVETVASSHTLSDEAKDSTLRPLRIAIRDAINGLEAEVDQVCIRLAKLYFGATYFRLRDRDNYYDSVCMEPRLWRDNEDALTTMASIVSRFQKKDMGPWIEIAEGVFECLKVAFGSKPHNKGALRSAIDHLLDISHHDGNIMSWLGKKSRREEADELLHFPTLFFEFRRYVGLHPGADMVGFISELFKLAKAEARFDIPHSVDHLDESPMFEKRYPLISHTIRKTRDTHKFNRLIRYTVDFINDDYRSGKRLSKFLPPRFLNGLKEEVDVRGKRVEDLRLQFEKIKQAYGYRAE